MNIILTVHPNSPDAFDVELDAEDETTPASLEADNPDFWQAVSGASSYLSGLDGKLVTLGDDATVADLAIIIGKHVEGDMIVKAGRLPGSLVADPMTELNETSEDDE